MGNDDTERFLTTYNLLDDELRARLACGDRKVSHANLIDQLAKSDPLVHAMATRLHAFRALRNALVHISATGVREPIATPLKSVVDEYERHLGYLRRPPLALDAIAVPLSSLFTVGWGTLVPPAIDTMLKNSFRLAPIVEDGKLVGAFTESTLWQALQAEDGRVHVTPSTTFASFRRYCALEVDVLGVVLLPRTVTIYAVEQVFQERFARNVFTSAVFLTETGAASAPLLGLITAHDLPSVNPRASQSMLDRLARPARDAGATT
jgi:CBS domain-containing protein